MSFGVFTNVCVTDVMRDVKSEFLLACILGMLFGVFTNVCVTHVMSDI